jgi:hypothetical protein
VGDSNGASKPHEPKKWLRLLVEKIRAAAGLTDPPPRLPDAPHGTPPPRPDEPKDPPRRNDPVPGGAERHGEPNRSESRPWNAASRDRNPDS